VQNRWVLIANEDEPYRFVVRSGRINTVGFFDSGQCFCFFGFGD